MSLTTYDQRTIAAKLGRSLKTFQNSRRQFYAVGMPLPADLPGNPVWFADEFDDWLLSRSPNRAATPAAPAPVADAPPVKLDAWPRAAPVADVAPPAKRGPGRPPKLAASQGRAAQ